MFGAECRYEEQTDKLYPSVASFEEPPPLKTRLTLEILELFRLVRLERSPPPQYQTADKSGIGARRSRRRQKGRIVSTTNLTILNFLLIHFGPMHEQTLCLVLAGVQVLGSVIAFGVRYGVGSWLYGGDRR
jgi:UDP-N-acetylglucosamine--dolichyl-phosphate N-acetylglucosaminephosphotransferase